MPTATDADTVSLIADLCDYIRAHADQRLTLAALGRQAGMSPSHLQRVFRRVVGVSPRQFADACRLGNLKAQLKKGDSVTTALTDAGYGSPSRLYEHATARLGMTPGQYQKGAPVPIRFTTAACPLGMVILAATHRPRSETATQVKRGAGGEGGGSETATQVKRGAGGEGGVRWLSFGDSDDEMEAALRAEFPKADISRADDDLKPWREELLRHFAGEQPHLALPLDVRATAFQRRVWDALMAIPYGETRSYKQVAEAIGAPTAFRAVARACATNPVAVVVPCHRVVGSDGTLTGYAGGLHRKKKLLENEKKN